MRWSGHAGLRSAPRSSAALVAPPVLWTGMTASRRQRLWHALIRSRFPLKGALIRTYLRMLERRRSYYTRDADAVIDSGLPVPPSRLRVLVNGIPDREWFLASGQAQANHLRKVTAEARQPVTEMGALLDFGCGCGRLMRWWAPGVAPRVFGCDYNPELASWCRNNLSFAEIAKTDLMPPLPYGDDMFDLVYAFSVFTHLTVDVARHWMAELRRVTKTGGLVWFTVHGVAYRERLLPEQRARFDDGHVVVWFPEIEGTNLCAAYWPDSAVAGMVGDGFRVVSHLDPVAEPAAAQTAQIAPHDSYLMRKV